MEVDVKKMDVGISIILSFHVWQKNSYFNLFTLGTNSKKINK